MTFEALLVPKRCLVVRKRVRKRANHHGTHRKNFAQFNNATSMLLLLAGQFLLLLISNVESAPPKQSKPNPAVQQGAHYRSKRSESLDSLLQLEKEKQSHYRRTQFIEKLFHTYDRRVLPNLDGPTTVNCSLFINNFDSISEVTMDYAVGVYLRQSWIDPRLRFDPVQNNNESMVTLDAKSFDKLWVPDLFFTNEKRASFHSITVPNRLIRLNPVGMVLYSVRLSLTLSCVMDLRKFPLDSQVCTMMIESYAYTTDKIILQWRPDPLEVSNELMIPQFNLRTFDFADCSKRYATGNFSCLKASFYLDRDVGYYIIQTYLPSVLVVVLSWVAFWIDPTAVPARVTFGVFTTLILSTMSSSVRSTLPRVSYVKAIDVWMSVCMFFVFTALIEYAIVNVVLRQKPKKPIKPAPQPPSQQQQQQQQQPLQQMRSTGVGINIRSPGHEPVSPASSHLLSSREHSDHGETIRYADDRSSRPYYRGNATKTSSGASSSGGNVTGPEVWIPLETHMGPTTIDSGAPRGIPPSSLTLSPAGGGNVDDNNVEPAVQVVDPPQDMLLIRGPANAFDICFYWHRAMLRLSEMEGKEKGQMVENWARKVFPLSFLFFNIVYWLVYIYYI